MCPDARPFLTRVGPPMAPRASIAVVFAAAALSACGGGGAGEHRLSARDYRARLTAISHRAAVSENAVQRAFKAKTFADLRRTLLRFAADQQSIGKAVAEL